MQWKYRPEFKTFPGVKLSYGKKGIKTDISFTPVNTEDDVNLKKEKLTNKLYKPYDIRNEIKSEAIDKLTSPDLKEFKTLLLQASASYIETNYLLNGAREVLESKNRKLYKLRKSIFKKLFKKRISRLEAETAALTEEVSELTTQLHLSVIHLEIDTEDIYFELYKNIRDAFHLLKQSDKKWDVTSSKQTNRVAERTSAASAITRSTITLTERSLPVLQTSTSCFCVHNINGGDIYIFPAFMIVYESKDEFALIDYTDIQITYHARKFIEDETVPKDSKIIGHTWHKVNKDGSPDRRFSSNYQIPIVVYGEISIRSASGVNELYSFSNNEYAALFYQAMYDYIDSLTTAKKMLAGFK